MKQWLLSLGAIIVGATGLYLSTDQLRAITSEGARRINVFENKPEVPTFIVEDMTGAQTSLHSQSNELVLVEFIYTTCPTICQTAGAEFAQLRDALKVAEIPARMISISFDPEVDDLEALQGYGEMHGATGNPWTIAKLSMTNKDAVLRFFDVTVIPDNWGGYQHNAAALMINQSNQHVGVFDTNAVDQIVEAASKWN